jgi:hypothetical protein
MAEVSGFLLERYNIGEVMPDERAAVERALACDEALAGRLAALRRSDAAIRERYLHAQRMETMPGTGQRFPVRLRMRRRLSFQAAMAIVCVALSALGGSWGLWGKRPPLADRAKGGAEYTAEGTSLAVYLKAADTDIQSPKAVSDGNERVTLREGDTIQLAYTAVPDNAGAAVYGVIFSIDGRSTLTLHYPAQADGETRLAAGRRTALDEAYTLDDAPRFEAFFMVVSAEPLDVNVVLDRARLLANEAARDRFPDEAAAASAKLFAGFAVRSLVISKAPPGAPQGLSLEAAAPHGLSLEAAR